MQFKHSFGETLFFDGTQLCCPSTFHVLFRRFGSSSGTPVCTTCSRSADLNPGAGRDAAAAFAVSCISTTRPFGHGTRRFNSAAKNSAFLYGSLQFVLAYVVHLECFRPVSEEVISYEEVNNVIAGEEDGCRSEF
mmetsp:Transcript_32175/g.58538  ORF Transcript_32175/g.58538 Transcript_32175/m.58538 type:complete len:135 (+) Transcript_32175:128-532(+)